MKVSLWNEPKVVLFRELSSGEPFRALDTGCERYLKIIATPLAGNAVRLDDGRVIHFGPDAPVIRVKAEYREEGDL